MYVNISKYICIKHRGALKKGEIKLFLNLMMLIKKLTSIKLISKIKNYS